MSDDLVPIGDALRAVSRELGVRDVGAMGRVQAAWTDLVGERLATHTSPLHVRDGVLTVVADGPAWASQLRYLGQALVDGLEGVVGPGAVRQVRVRISRPDA